MSVTNIINERVETNNGSNLDVFGKNQTVDLISNIVNERVETEERLGDELVQNGNFSELGSDRWSLVDIEFTGANTFENTATNGRIFQSFTTIVGSKYKVSATINSGTWNVVASTNNNTSGQIVLTGNTITSEFFEFTATSTTSFLALYNIGASGSVASITNISVVEVGVDREAFTNETDQHNSTVTNIVNERVV